MNTIAMIALVTFSILNSHCYHNMVVPVAPVDIRPLVQEQIRELLADETSLLLLPRTPNDLNNIYVEFFLRSSQISLTITGNHSVKDLRQPNLWDNFLITTSLNRLSKESDVHVEAKGYHFFVLEENYLDWDILRPILHIAWQHHRSLHVYLLTSIGIITYDPFVYNISRSEYGSVVWLEDRMSVGEIFQDLKGYPLTIEIFRSVYSRPEFDSAGNFIRVTGADALVAFELQRIMNFTYVPQKPDNDNFGYMTDNGTFNGALGRAISNQIDIALTAFFIKDYFTRDAEFTVAVYSDQLCCYVPKAARVPQSILPLFSFSWDMWMCYCFSAITCAVIWSLIRCVNLVLFKYNASSYGVTWNVLHFLQIFIDTWIVWVRVSLRKFPGFGSEKLFLGSVCLVSVIFGAVFESSLATVYIKPLYYKDISTLQELDATGLKILYKYASMGDDLFAKGSSDLFNKLESKLRLVVFKESVMGTMVKKGDFASVTRESSISLESIQYFAANKLYMVPECPKTYTLAYVLPKDSPFANRINLLLLQFLNAGLIDKWIDDMYFEAKLDDMNKNVKDGSQGAKVLTLNDLQLPFYVIGMGALIGFTTLAGEFYMKKR